MYMRLTLMNIMPLIRLKVEAILSTATEGSISLMTPAAYL